MNAREMLAAALKAAGADGLCTDDCGCHIRDLMPCGEYCGDCEPAKAIPGNDAWRYGISVDGETEIVMVPLDAEPETAICCRCGDEYHEDNIYPTLQGGVCVMCWVEKSVEESEK